ncbi:acyl-CoA dehydrogenase [Mucilaginibacter sp. dw_454]|uniref:acyl-CoA dehydrogenase n=1 Tax=Mucilaginibacter sp. dw_454 TaxID=2720079 RepID=UPI001BD3F3BF|nr:acyl-CoA dehydrogenase [Mucilaginibacter sp. dw_454]
MENQIPHPSAFISADDVNIIRKNAAEAERLGMLHPEQLKIVYREAWFKLLVPQVYSGKQITLSNLVRLQEAISWADGSTGWVVTLCSGAGWFGGFINAELSQQIFNNTCVCLAGSGAVSGTAEKTDNGYIIYGFWKYASGVHHATHITANCAITQNGQPVLSDDGGQLVLPFIFDKKDVSPVPAWKYIGMIATGSDAFEIKDLQVGKDRAFKIDPSAVVVDAPLYRYPFLQLAEATLAVNLSGIAVHFIDLCADIFNDRMNHPRLTPSQKIILIDSLALANREMSDLRKLFFAAVDLSWKDIVKNNSVSDSNLNEVSIHSRKLAISAREIVDRLYPLCGLVAAGSDTEINRAWRDLHTASQHSLLTFAMA